MKAQEINAVFQGISIHSPRMGRDDRAPRIDLPAITISIHSPRMGRDMRECEFSLSEKISIHSPRMGRDLYERDKKINARLFQSTLPAWGETLRLLRVSLNAEDFNPLSPHGERRIPIRCQT